MDRFFGFLEQHPLFDYQESGNATKNYFFCEKGTIYIIKIPTKMSADSSFPIEYEVHFESGGFLTNPNIYEAPDWCKLLYKKVNDQYFSKYKLQYLMENKKRTIENVIRSCLLFSPFGKTFHRKIKVFTKQTEMPICFLEYKTEILTSLKKHQYKVSKIKTTKDKLILKVK